MSAAVPDSAEILAFARRFWELVGAPLEREGRAFRVELPPHLEEHFGTRTLRFALTAEEAWISGAEVLAPGSFLLSRMHDYVRDRGTHVVFERPSPTPVPTPAAIKEEVASRVRVVDARVVAMSSSEAWPVRLAVDAKVVYQTDEIEEDLVRVVEEEGGTISTREVKPGAAWAGAREAAPDLLSRLELASIEKRYAGALDRARRFALRKGRTIEGRAVKRLAENLARIQGYFSQIRSEISGVDERRSERLRELEVEERLKTGEEVDAHRVRIRIVPIALSLLAVPSRRVTFLLESRGTSVELALLREIESGRLDAGALGIVPEEGISVTVCRGELAPEAGGGEHVCLAERAPACAGCSARTCEKHGTDCPGCSRRLCGGCGSRCALCDRKHCPEHAPRACVRCGRAACATCASICVTCGEPACRDDARACAVCGSAVCLEHAVSCACGATVCSRDVVLDPVSQIRYCGKCAITCADCATPMGRATSQLCGSCGARLCRDHAIGCTPCGKANVKLCAEHRVKCNACGTDVCRSRHRRRCRVCAQDVCGGCLDGAGRCRLCVDVLQSRRGGARPPLAPLPSEAAGVVEWHCRKGASSDLYFGRARGGGSVLLVIGHDGSLVRASRSAAR